MTTRLERDAGSTSDNGLGIACCQALSAIIGNGTVNDRAAVNAFPRIENEKEDLVAVYPRAKVDTARRKLECENPVHIIIDELEQVTSTGVERVRAAASLDELRAAENELLGKRSPLAAFNQLPAVRVLFDNGAGTSPTGSSTPGDPYAGFEKSFASLPVPGTVARTWYFGPGGTLTGNAPASAGVRSFIANASALPLTDYGTNTGTGGLWGNASQWKYSWKPWPAGNAVSYVSAPLRSNAAVIGAGAVHVWVRSSTP